MNIEKFTAASKSLIASTQMIAAKNNHQQITPLHGLAFSPDRVCLILIYKPMQHT